MKRCEETNIYTTYTINTILIPLKYSYTFVSVPFYSLLTSFLLFFFPLPVANYERGPPDKTGLSCQSTYIL